MLPTDNSPKSILATLNGSQIHIPPLEPMFAHWPMGVSAHRKKLEFAVESRIDLLCEGKAEMYLYKMSACDFALFAASLWPHATYERLEIMVFFTIWVFMWDDEIDDATGTLFDQLNEANKLRKDTLRFIKQCLRMDEQEDIFEPENFIVRSFDVIGQAISEVYSQDQRKRFFDEVLYFIENCEKEQYVRMREQQITLEEYNSMRIGTVAAPMLVALNEFTTQTILPKTFLEHSGMKMLSDQTSLIGAYINDILSVQKEVAKGAPCSLIPLLYAPHRDINRATTEAIQIFKKSIHSFDSTARDILDDIGRDSTSISAAEEFVKYCRFMCTGLLYWSLRSKRYGLMQSRRDADGGIYLTLVTKRPTESIQGKWPITSGYFTSKLVWVIFITAVATVTIITWK